MEPGRRAFALITAIIGAAPLLLTLPVSAARAGTAMPGVHPAIAGPLGNGLVYAAHTRELSANGTSSSTVACPSGTRPVGGGTGLQNPRLQHVVQAGFIASATTGEVNGYEASVQVSGLTRRAQVQFAVQVACVPSATTAVIYPVRTLTLSAEGTTWWGAPCPAGTLPTGGGTAVQNPRIEHVTEAGFVSSATTGKVDGYEASVRVSGLARGASVRFAVQVACVSSATTAVIYAVHTQMLRAQGTTSSGVACPAGTAPVGGGAAVQDPLAGSVAQAGFVVSAATGKLDGYEASVQVSGLARGASVRAGVQVACIRAATQPVDGPPTVTAQQAVAA